MWFWIIISTIWISCAITSIITKDSDVMRYALVATIAIGFGYLLLVGAK